MLVEFSVTNFRSIKETATLSMVAAPTREHEDSHTIQVEGQLRLLRSAAIYGPNASGKSNFLKAYDVMRSIIVDSSKSQRGDKLPVVPHLFDVASSGQPSEFEVTFISDGVRYQYGFAANRDRIVEEWLFAYPKGRSQRWFSREYNNETNDYETTYSERLLGQKQLWIEATRENSLFLATAVQLNSKQLAPVFDWFDNKAALIGYREGYPHYTASLCTSDDAPRKIVAAFLKQADLDIKDLHVTEKKYDLSKLPKDLPEEIKKEFLDRTFFEVKLSHEVIGGEDVYIDLDEESDGTQKFFSLIGPLMETFASGGVLFADELNDNLHPNMLKFLVSLFHDPRLNSHGAQLIFSTHDTAILDQKYLRRDQVWFVDKKKDHSTKLYPLSDFSPRKGREDLSKNYLLGRYGALPYFKGVASAMGVESGQ
jgi:AAA15 family ATPase/GTPase